MSRKLVAPMPDHIARSQRAASDPTSSVWVTANAGSGKTYVLTARVLRLLLSGVKPEEILCLTYTKAAAAEMRGRVAERLGQWTLMDDAALAASLTDLEGAPPIAAMILRARSLFAHALETPGGLKIQTIHAFCESVLHRFPKEAGVPFDFTVLEDHQRDTMLVEAREQVIAAGVRGTENTAAVETLMGLLSEFQIEQSIVEALGQQRILRKVLAEAPEAKRQLRKLIRGAASIDDVLTEIAEGYPLNAGDHAEIFALTRPDPSGTDFIDRLSQIDPERPDPEALLDAFLTQAERTARKTLIKKATAALIPEIAARLVAEGARLERLALKLVAAELLERSEAMLDIVAAISAHYERAKRARSLLDFDDLIGKLAALLEDEALGPWVQYKLDSGISHILVDESQDTNAEQWRVVEALVADFFSGESAAQRPRTVFAVGDQKQSIFSFQGADPEEFIAAGRKYELSARTVRMEFRRQPLHTSFRTLPNLLRAVDTVFAQEELRLASLEEAALVHDTARAEGGGVVTLWPPIKEIEEESDPANWPTKAPDAVTKSAPRRVAERMAREIRFWVDSGRPLGPRGRAVTADDVLILVQVRSVLFHEIIRALIREGLPTPGADRLAVTTHIAALDLMALGDVLLNPADDLQLAALLRSPLFEVSEEELLATAQPRHEGATLWSALERSSIASVREAHERLRSWRSRLDFERPFNFYAEVLYAGGGLRRLRARLGSEVDDVAAQFLDLALAHEQEEQPSLQGLLSALRSRQVIIKRELGETGAGVRVMTVHGAKGLEAPIVILADAASTEEGRGMRTVFMQSKPPLFLHAPNKKSHVEESRDYKVEADAAQRREYWRKLYVAMTRAEDELYITGYLTKARDGADSWYQAIETALRPDAEIVADAEGVAMALVFPAERAREAAARAEAAPEPAAGIGLDLPSLPAYRLRRIVRPSSALADTAAETVLNTAAERLADRRDPEAARKEGIALHALLQHLGRLDPASWPAVIEKALPVLLPEAPEQHPALGQKARSILTRPELTQLFANNSRAEVPILAQGTRNGHPVTIAGRIDRLVVEPERVLVVDYKSDANAPATPNGVPKAYLAQLGLYAQIAGLLFPGRQVDAAILWTGPESLMNLPPASLREAVSGFTIG